MTRERASAIVLGPARDPRAEHPRDPLEARRRVARALESEGVPAVILEDEPQPPGEPSIEFYLRTLEEREVRTYVLFWPPHAHLHGMDVEIGILLTELARGRLDPERVILLAHRDVIGLGATDPDQDLTWRERDNRTGYYHDLFAYGCAIELWSDAQELEARAHDIARRHRRRHRRS